MDLKLTDELCKKRAFDIAKSLAKQEVIDEKNLARNEEQIKKNKVTPPKGGSPIVEKLTDFERKMIPTRQLLKLADRERQEKVQSAMTERANKFNEFSEAQEKQRKQSWLDAQQSFVEAMKRNEMEILLACERYELEQASENAKMLERSRNAMRRMKENEELLKEKQKRNQIWKERVDAIESYQQRFNAELEQVATVIKMCQNKEQLRNAPDLDFMALKALPEQFAAVVAKCKSGEVTEMDVASCQETLKTLTEFKDNLITLVNAINEAATVARKEAMLKEQEERRRQEVLVQLPPPAAAAAPPPPPQDTVISVKPAQDTSGVNQKLSNYVSLGDLQFYAELMEFQQQFQQTFRDLENDASLKTFKFDCKKAINIPVNALSGANPAHILDKYIKLNKLLAGQVVVVGDKQICAAGHSQGINFCTDTLAKKFVLQGDLIVSANPEAAFCYASVIVSLWNDFPDFGKLLLAYFYKTCPYLVPYYVPRETGDSDEDYYKKLGYLYSDGEVEKQDKFLKRMTGIMRLYFAIMIARPKNGQNGSPFNLKHGWKWLASFLKLEPELDITATALHVFLETLGYEMEMKYYRMFHKVLKLIFEVFFPKCQQAKCTGGAVTRLELLLTEYLKNKKFEKPDSYIEYSYW